MQTREEIQKAYTEWQEKTYKKNLEKFPERLPNFSTVSNSPIDPLYIPTDTTDKYNEKIGYPGQYPFTRGIQPTMYRGRFWTMRQYAGFGTAKESNERYRYLLDAGQTGL